MNGSQFNAVIKTPEEKLIEYGMATLLRDTNAADFTSDFVPLLKMGEKVKLYRLFNGQQKQCFEGEVYFSSKNLLRIILTNAQKPDEAISNISFLYNTSLKAKVQSADEPQKGSYEASVYSISDLQVKFNCTKKFMPEEWVRIAITGPMPIKDLKVEVAKIIELNEGVFCHICDIVHMSPIAMKKLDEYKKSNEPL